MIRRDLPMAPPAVDPVTHAFFLDFDGTLVDIADHPEEVVLSPAMAAVLTRLSPAADGALAIVTGREITAIDRFMAPLHLPVAGVHGLERRGPQGVTSELPSRAASLDPIATRLEAFASARPGVLVERKRNAIALHYRQAPQFADDCRQIMLASFPPDGGFALVEGKCVYELRCDTHDKGGAIAAFLEEAPFAGRTPVFAGDDVTDEDGFTIVNRRHGISIKVGAGDTVARYRLDGPGQLATWLEDVVSLAPAGDTP